MEQEKVENQNNIPQKEFEKQNTNGVINNDNQGYIIHQYKKNKNKKRLYFDERISYKKPRITQRKKIHFQPIKKKIEGTLNLYLQRYLQRMINGNVNNNNQEFIYCNEFNMINSNNQLNSQEQIINENGKINDGNQLNLRKMKIDFIITKG
jgi:hypothetical protein